MNANLIFTWLRDPRYAPAPDADAAQEPLFLPVEVIEDGGDGNERTVEHVEASTGHLEIDLAGGHRLRVIGAYDAEALAGLIRRLST